MAPRTKVRPLLSLATAASLTACGSTPTAGGTPTIAHDPAPSVSAEPVATPRLMPSGRPACGNVATRAPPDPSCKPQ
ncbi:MAG: hypothetical protein ACXWUG_07570 [Polyangiales bacterium]